MADIPGLVEGAHKGIGLGDKFLRHIERCKILLHLLDITEENLVENYKKIKIELSAYDKKLSKKREIVFFNKLDLLEKKEIQNKLKIFKKKINKEYDFISVFSQKDIKKLKQVLIKNVNK